MKYEPEWVQQAIKDGKHPFFVQMPVKIVRQDGKVTIKGLGSKVERSRSGHKMKQGFIDKMKQTVAQKPMLVNHNPDEIAGIWETTDESSNDEFRPIGSLLQQHENPIVDAARAKVQHWIDQGVPLGLSIGGIASDSSVVKEDGALGVDVEDGELIEITVTPIAALRSSDGSVTIQTTNCKDGICGQIAQQILNGPSLPFINESGGMGNVNKESENIKQATGVSLNTTCYDNALLLISNENVDFETPWNRGKYEWNQVDEQSLYCLGIDETSNFKEDQFQYRIGMNGLIYKHALLSVAASAPEGSAVYEAADELLGLIYVLESSLETDGNVTENMDGESMNKEEQEKFDKLMESNQKQQEFINQMIEEKKEAKRVAEAAKLKEEQDKAQMDVVTQCAEAAGEVMATVLGQVLQNRNGVIQNSMQAGAGADPEGIIDPTQIDGNQPASVNQNSSAANFRDPVQYPSVVMGKVMQGVTPKQLFGVEE